MTTDTVEEPQAEAPTGDSMYAWLGGEQAIKDLVNRFYDIMESDESLKPIRDMHKEDLSPMRLSLFEFLSGWLGGPSLFIERHGSPCLTGAHKPFKIDALHLCQTSTKPHASTSVDLLIEENEAMCRRPPFVELFTCIK